MNLGKLTSLLKLNQLSLDDMEQDRVLAAFKMMSAGEELLAAFDTSGTERMVHVIQLTNVLREDNSSQPFAREKLLQGAPQQTDGCWQVPRLID